MPRPRAAQVALEHAQSDANACLSTGRCHVSPQLSERPRASCRCDLRHIPACAGTWPCATVCASAHQLSSRPEPTPPASTATQVYVFGNRVPGSGLDRAYLGKRESDHGTSEQLRAGHVHSRKFIARHCMDRIAWVRIQCRNVIANSINGHLVIRFWNVAAAAPLY